MEAGAEAAGVLQELRHRVDRHVRQPRDGAHRSALAEHGEDLGALGNRELVHANYMNFLLSVKHYRHFMEFVVANSFS